MHDPELNKSLMKLGKLAYTLSVHDPCCDNPATVTAWYLLRVGDWSVRGWAGRFATSKVGVMRALVRVAKVYMLPRRRCFEWNNSSSSISCYIRVVTKKLSPKTTVLSNKAVPQYNGISTTPYGSAQSCLQACRNQELRTCHDEVFVAQIPQFPTSPWLLS
jgi:hypothetical protein